MLLLSRHIALLIGCAALVLSTSAHAGLYGFTQTGETPHTEQSDIPPRHIFNYRKAMRDLLTSVSHYAKSRVPDFQILAHEGQYLLDKSLWEYHLDGYNEIRRSNELVDDISFLSGDIPETDENTPAEIKSYVAAIDGLAVNNHYCGNKPVDSLAKHLDLPVFSIEQCSTEEALDDAVARSFADKTAVYPFMEPELAFRSIYRQLIINETADTIRDLKEARNVSFLINDENFSTPYQMIEDIRNSNYDVVIIRPVFHNKIPFDKEQVESMKFKKNGAERLILALYNISEIAETDYLWQKKWDKNKPDWIMAKSPVNKDAFITKYWTPKWKHLVGLYVKSIVDSGYNGIFITGLENHSYFEYNKPLE